jgi:hypothetical protein
MDLQSDVNEMNRKLLQFIGKEMNELDDKIRLLKKENDLLRKEIENDLLRKELENLQTK